MDAWAITLVSALWLGILTSISPCPLATNVAAMSFIAKDVESLSRVLISGISYTLGRVFTYAVIGSTILGGILMQADIADFLENYMQRFLGPVMIIIGLVILDMLVLDFLSFKASSGEKAQRLARKGGIAASFLLGVIFALSFCPVSAGLFFGSLISLGLKQGSHVIVPSVFGIGTGLPVLVFAFAVAFGVSTIGNLFDKVKTFEFYARRITGILFIGVGIYYSIAYSW